jgi:hypothetical protein
MIYSRFHRIIEEIDSPTALGSNITSALNMFAVRVREGGLQRKYFRRFLSRRVSANLLRISDEYDRDYEEFRKTHGLDASH